jgi:hypothetical protein
MEVVRLKSLEEISVLEEKEQWREAIEKLEFLIESNENAKEATVRLIFLLWYLLLEKGVINCDIEDDQLERKLRFYFHQSKKENEENPHYLFFTGYIMGIAHWYFSDDKNVASEKVAIQMLEKARQLEPFNPLLKWGLLAATSKANDDPGELKDLSHTLQEQLESLFANRGALGQYFKQIISSTGKNL